MKHGPLYLPFSLGNSVTRVGRRHTKVYLPVTEEYYVTRSGSIHQHDIGVFRQLADKPFLISEFSVRMNHSLPSDFHFSPFHSKYRSFPSKFPSDQEEFSDCMCLYIYSLFFNTNSQGDGFLQWCAISLCTFFALHLCLTLFCTALVHTNFFVDYPRLVAPNTKYVGGMHVREPAPLPQRSAENQTYLWGLHENAFFHFREKQKLCKNLRNFSFYKILVF